MTDEERAEQLRLALQEMNTTLNFIHSHRFLDIGSVTIQSNQYRTDT